MNDTKGIPSYPNRTLDLAKFTELSKQLAESETSGKVESSLGLVIDQALEEMYLCFESLR